MEKERRTKALLLSTLVVVVATVSIAFAAMSRTLSINGIGKMDTASWSVYFDNLSSAKITRGAEEVGKPNISTTDNGIIENINVKLSNPKDEISYTVDIVNAGTIDAEITMIKDIVLTDVQKKVFEFKVTYTDTGEVLKDGDVLPAGDTKNITINIKFKDDITEFDLPTESQTINLSYQITYTQYDGEIQVGPNGGTTTEKAILARGLTLDEMFESEEFVPFFNSTINRTQVESLSFVNNTNVPTEASSTVWDASEAKDNSIVGWYQDTDSNELYEVYIGSDANIYAPVDSSGLFAMFVELKEINFNNFNTFDVENMAYMFFGCMAMTSLDVSNFDTSNVTDMGYMFYYCSSLISLDLSHFDVSSVTTMEGMFYGDEGDESKLQSINLSGWNAINVETMNSMFSYCVSLTDLNLSNFNTEKVTDMSSMFSNCSSLTSLDVSSFDTSSVTDMSSMFSSCSSLTSLDLSSFNTSQVTDMGNMFHNCTTLTELKFNSADFSKMSSSYANSAMFYGTNSLTVYVKDKNAQEAISQKNIGATNLNVIIQSLAS